MSALPKELTGGAVISGDYRYELWRDWHSPLERLDGSALKFVLWIMLNPSKAAGLSPAGKLVHDPTLGKCIGFTHRMGFRRLSIANLYALRSTDPAALLKHHEPVGPECDQALRNLAASASAIVVGWGAFSPKFIAPRVARVRELLAGRPLLCLGAVAGGAPGHPLFVPYDRPLVAWAPVVAR